MTDFSSSPVQNRKNKTFFLLLLLVAALNVDALDLSGWSPPLFPVVDNSGLYELRDDIYYFPANTSPRDKTVYLPLMRWDIIFTGDHVDTPDNQLDDENVNRLIPGPFNHIMVYMGKDWRGLAYAAELNTSSFDDPGGLRIICLGSDYALIRHPDQLAIHDRRLMNRRWAMRFTDQALAQILSAEPQLLARLQGDLVLGFPYQFEFSHSGSLYDPNVYLVDDGFAGGAGCSDYWTTLFEELAGVCLKGVRMSAAMMEDYFRNDPEGRLAYAPADISPFPQALLIRTILERGYKAVDDDPHVFSCDQSEETGIVIPSLIMKNPLLEEIQPVGWPVKLPWIAVAP